MIIVEYLFSLSQWPTFKLLGIPYLIGKISRLNFNFMVLWLSIFANENIAVIMLANTCPLGGPRLPVIVTTRTVTIITIIL